MSNADVANELTQLREYVASGAIPPDEAAAAFERPTFLLMDDAQHIFNALIE